MRYDYTTIEYSEWPNTPMFGLDTEDYITVNHHFKHNNLLKEIDVSLTVGGVDE